ncbi:TPA: EpsG family protein [Citrobacter amalonaticus]|nr:EpsG family protein [Citrobacter amalonaticus]
MVYWLILAGISFSAMFARNKFGDNLGVFFLFITAGFIAPGVSQDYYNYVNGYYLTSPVLFPETFSKLIFRITAQLGLPISVSFIVFAFLSLYIKKKALNRLGIPITVFLVVYFSKLFLLLDLTQVRASVAVAFCLLALNEYIRNNIKACILYIIIGFFFHFSAIMFFVVFLVGKKAPKKLLWLTLVLLSMALAMIDLRQILFSLLSILHAPANYMVYLTDTDNFEVNPFSLLSIVNVLVFVAFSLYCTPGEGALTNVCYKLYGISILSFYLFINFPVLSFRISEFFLVYQVILISGFIKNIKATQRIIYIALLMVFSVLQLYITYNVAGIISDYKFL